jgi:hypothetical protein
MAGALRTLAILTCGAERHEPLLSTHLLTALFDDTHRDVTLRNVFREEVLTQEEHDAATATTASLVTLRDGRSIHERRRTPPSSRVHICHA